MIARLTERASRLARKGHPWFFRDDLEKVEAENGVLVRVEDFRGRDLGLGFYGSRARNCLRLCGSWSGEGVPGREEFFRQRLTAAVQRRGSRLGPKSGVRLVHGEADGVPGLVVDAYGTSLVLQATTAAVDRSLDAIVPVLVERAGAEMVLARHDLAVRRLEGLPEEVALLHGRRIEEVEIEEHGVVHRVRLFAGQKTGFYLDQRQARGIAQELASGRRVLDLFAYQGAFGLAALAGGAVSALAVDQSADALGLAEEAARRNGLAGLEVLRGNGFRVLRRLRDEGRDFDLVVLDPPAFAKSRREVSGAQRGYRDLNRNALRLLAPGGTLITCSCSHHLIPPMFEDILRQSAAGLPFRIVLRQRIMAGPDHPVWISLPESEYLKILVLERGD